MYDRPGLDKLTETASGGWSSRTRADDEADAIAFDLGAAGGGANAEEAAMHQIPQEEGA